MTNPQIEETISAIETAEVITSAPVVKINNPPPAMQMLQMIEKAANNPRMNVDKMREMMFLQKEFMAIHAENEFNAAMARLQPKLPFIDKKGRIAFEDNKGNQRNTPYARFEDIEGQIRPLYSAEGFSTSYDVETVVVQGAKEPFMVIILTISHALGHKRTFKSPPMPADTSGKKNAIQALGSTQSYGKRYCLTNGFGIVVKGEDDDGKKGGAEAAKKDSFADKVGKQAKTTGVKRTEAEIIQDAEAMKKDLKSIRNKKDREKLIGDNLAFLRTLEGIKRGDIVTDLHAIAAQGE